MESLKHHAFCTFLEEKEQQNNSARYIVCSIQPIVIVHRETMTTHHPAHFEFWIESSSPMHNI